MRGHEGNDSNQYDDVSCSALLIIQFGELLLLCLISQVFFFKRKIPSPQFRLKC